MSRTCPHCKRFEAIPELGQLPHLVTQTEAARVLGASTTLLAKWLDDPEVPLFRHPTKRIRRADLEAFLGPPTNFVPGPIHAMRQRLEAPRPKKAPKGKTRRRAPEERPVVVGRTDLSGTAQRILAGLFEIGIGQELTWAGFALVMQDQPGWGSASERSIRLSYEAVRGELLNAGAKVAKEAPRLESVTPRLLERLWPAA